MGNTNRIKTQFSKTVQKRSKFFDVQLAEHDRKKITKVAKSKIFLKKPNVFLTISIPISRSELFCKVFIFQFYEPPLLENGENGHVNISSFRCFGKSSLLRLTRTSQKYVFKTVF